MRAQSITEGDIPAHVPAHVPATWCETSTTCGLAGRGRWNGGEEFAVILSPTSAD
jgi:hypothetical protein